MAMIPAVHASHVLDASVAAKWFARHDEENRRKAIALRDLHRSGRCRLVVPELCLLEILDALRFGPRAEESDGEQALSALEQLHLRAEPLDWDLLRKANPIAWAYGVTLYDAAYVTLAEKMRLPPDRRRRGPRPQDARA